MLIGMMKLHIVLVVTIVLITNKASCGVIENVYDKVSNTTHDVKEDIHSWWTYGVDTVMGEDKNAANGGSGNENESGIIGKLYNKVKGGVSSGYMKVHNFVLGQDSDPNKGIIRTFYERAMNRLSNIKSYIFGDNHAEKPERANAIEKEKQEVLKILFSNRTDIFNTQSEKSALDSLRKKLTQTGDEVLHLADNEKDVLRKAYESVRHKSDDLLNNAGESADKMKNKFNEGLNNAGESAGKMKDKFNEGLNNAGETADKMKNKFNEGLNNAGETADTAKNKFNEGLNNAGEFADTMKNKFNEGLNNAGETADKMKNKFDEGLNNAGESGDKMKNKFNEGIQKTQEFIQDETKKAKEAANERFNAGIERTQEFIQDESNKAKAAAKRIGE